MKVIGELQDHTILLICCLELLTASRQLTKPIEVVEKLVPGDDKPISVDVE